MIRRGSTSRVGISLVTDDKMIPIAAQRLMAKRAGSTVVEVGGSHAIYVSNPKAVAEIIEKAAKGRRDRGSPLRPPGRDEENARVFVAG